MGDVSESDEVLAMAAQQIAENTEESYYDKSEAKTTELALRLFRINDNEETKNRKYKYRRRALYAQLLLEDYFTTNGTFDDGNFRTRFRMGRRLFMRIFEAMKGHDEYFTQRPDALGRPGHDPLSKIVAVFRMLAYGTSADSQDEHFRIGRTTLLESMQHFCVNMLAIFGDEYLRSPTMYDIQRIMVDNVRRGFPGMLGYVDCMHWEWLNCPTGWHGQFRGHTGRPTIILEAVASYDTWIWHSFFGMPGSNNDINVLERSNLFHQILQGVAPEWHFSINGNQYNMGYYLADGIYPQLATIVQAYRQPDNRKKRLFTEAQEGARKDVERAFGVLQKRFAIVAQPARHWDREMLAYIMQTCVILHNMIVEDERRDANWSHNYDQRHRVSPLVRPERCYLRYTERREALRNRGTHLQLREDLVEHIWTNFGEATLLSN